MPRVLLRLMGVGILIFGLLIGGVSLIGRILPTKQLAYISAIGYDYDLILLDFYHRIPVKLFKNVISISWSPDGTRIAYTNTNYDLYIMDIFNHEIQRLTSNHGHNLNPSWSPDGQKIAFNSDYGKQHAIYVMPVDCTDSFERCATRLTPANDHYYISPVWSPDGKRIAFVTVESNITGIDTSVIQSDIFIMNLDGSHVQALTHDKGRNFGPNWSPDGRYIIYSALRSSASQMLPAKARLIILDTQCNEPNSCANSLFSDSEAFNPSWSPDDSSIVFAGDLKGKVELYITDMKGHYLQRVTYNDIDESNPQWRP